MSPRIAETVEQERRQRITSGPNTRHLTQRSLEGARAARRGGACGPIATGVGAERGLGPKKGLIDLRPRAPAWRGWMAFSAYFSASSAKSIASP